jgi:hypothetical protein
MNKNPNQNFFNFGQNDRDAYLNRKAPRLEVLEVNTTELDIKRQNELVAKGNKKKVEFNYYDLYTDFNEKKDNKDIIHKLDKAPFLFTNEHKQKYFQRYTDLKQCAEVDCLDANNAELVKEAFFLTENIEIIQNAIIRNVAKKSKYIISRQKEEDITIIMNGIYHDYARHLPYNLKEQVLELNERVINFVTPWILNEVEAYINYLVDADTPLSPPKLPINVAKQRKESLPSVIPR